MDKTNKMIIKLVVLLISVTVAMAYLKVVASKRAEEAERQKRNEADKQDPRVLMSSSKSFNTAIYGDDVEKQPDGNQEPAK